MKKNKVKVFIGDNLHKLRKQKRITLTELSEQSGIQMATLSRIENNKMTGTLESHLAIAKALGITVAELYQFNAVDISSAIKSTASVERNTHSGQAYYEILTQNPTSKRMLPVIIKIEPRGEIEEKPSSGERFLLILEGDVEIVYQNETFKLKKNQTLYLENLIKYTIKNLKETPAKLFSVTTPVNL